MVDEMSACTMYVLWYLVLSASIDGLQLVTRFSEVGGVLRLSHLIILILINSVITASYHLDTLISYARAPLFIPSRTNSSTF
ncbi:hypothetical protein QBC43DRAFT_363044, partial [Cladorrhinum sp. PSN259]